MGTRRTVVGGSDADRVRDLRQVLMARGHVVGSTWPVEELVARAVDADACAVLLVGDLAAADLRAIADTTADRGEVGVIVVGPVDPNVEVLIALASGVCSYLQTGSSPAVVADAVDAFRDGEVVLPRRVSLPLVAGLHHDGLGITVERPDRVPAILTRREWEVLVLARQGRTTGEMAERLVVSSPTVRTHVAALVRKLGLSGRAALLRPLRADGVRKNPRRRPFPNVLVTNSVSGTKA